jgi:hypothetical protein
MNNDTDTSAHMLKVRGNETDFSIFVIEIGLAEVPYTTVKAFEILDANLRRFRNRKVTPRFK